MRRRRTAIAAASTLLVLLFAADAHAEPSVAQLREQGRHYLREGHPLHALATLEEALRLPGGPTDLELQIAIHDAAIEASRPDRAFQALGAAGGLGRQPDRVARLRKHLAKRCGPVEIQPKGDLRGTARLLLTPVTRQVDPWKKRVVAAAVSRLRSEDLTFPLRVVLPFGTYSLFGEDFEHPPGPGPTRVKVSIPTLAVVRPPGDAFAAPVAAFRSKVTGHVVEVFMGRGEEERMRVLGELQRDGADLVFTLGTRATVLLQKRWHELPAVFALVPDWETLRLDQRSTAVTGVGFSLPPQLTLERVRALMPDAKRIGAVVRADLDEGWRREALRAARKAGVTLLLLPVPDAGAVLDTVERARDQVDVLWLLPDARLLTARVLAQVMRTAARLRLPLVTGAPGFAQAGALLSVSPDLEAVGAQAGELARQIVEEDTEPGDLPVAPPAGAVVHVNLKTAEHLGIRLDEAALRQAIPVGTP